MYRHIGQCFVLRSEVHLLFVLVLLDIQKMLSMTRQISEASVFPGLPFFVSAPLIEIISVNFQGPMHYFTMLLPKLKAIKAAAILPLLLLLLQATHTSTQRLGGGCLLSESPGVQKLMKKLQRPVPLYQGYPCSPDPVQGVHLALDGPQTLRVTWMNPVAPESGHFYPVCSYWAEESGNLSYVAKGQFYNYTAGRRSLYSLLTYDRHKIGQTVVGFPTKENPDGSFTFGLLLHLHSQLYIFRVHHFEGDFCVYDLFFLIQP